MEEQSLVYRVNIDFELQVQNQTSRSLRAKWEREWEYLFWWIEDDHCLLDQKRSGLYTQNEKDFILSKTKRATLFSHKAVETLIPWWGDMYTSAIQKSDLPKLRAEIFNDHNSYLGEPLSYPCVVKRNGAFSGQGVYFLNSEDQFRKLPKDQYITEPWRDKTRDIGSYIFSDKTIHYESFIGNKGEYLGSLFHASGDLSHDDTQKIERIASYMVSLGISSGYGIDSYYYNTSDGIEFFEPLCEINSRRTIASCSYQIFQKHFSKYQLLRTMILPISKLRSLGNLDFDDPRVVRISPATNQYFILIFIMENSKRELMSLIHEVQKFFNIP